MKYIVTKDFNGIQKFMGYDEKFYEEYPEAQMFNSWEEAICFADGHDAEVERV